MYKRQGKGHLTDYIIKQTLGKQTIVRFKSDRLPYHPNGMKFYVYQDEKVLDTITAYSIGGGTVEYEGSKLQQTKQIYPHKNLKEIIQYIEDNGISFYDYVLNYEDEHFKAYLFEVLDSMFTCVQNGLQDVYKRQDNDRVIGLLLKKGIQDLKLIINKVNLDDIEDGKSLTIDDALDILSLPLLGIVYEDHEMIEANNKGRPVYLLKGHLLHDCFDNIAHRLLGHKRAFAKCKRRGLLSRIFLG